MGTDPRHVDLTYGNKKKFNIPRNTPLHSPAPMLHLFTNFEYRCCSCSTMGHDEKKELWS